MLSVSGTFDFDDGRKNQRYLPGDQSLSRYELSQDSLLTDQRLQISVPHLPKQGPSSCH